MRLPRFKTTLFLLLFLSVAIVIGKNYIYPLAKVGFGKNYTKLYEECLGNPFDGSCTDESCIDEGIERRVFDLWKQLFMEAHNIDKDYFDKHILVDDVTYTKTTYKGMSKPLWRVNYVYKNDWVLSRQNESIWLALPDNVSALEGLSDEVIINRLKFEIRESERFDTSVISYIKVTKLMRKKKANYDFCSIRFRNQSGILFMTGVHGPESISLQLQSDCDFITLDLHLGNLETITAPCVME